MATLKHGLNIQKKPAASLKPLPPKRKTIFDDEDGSDGEETPNSKQDNVAEISTFDEITTSTTSKPNYLSKPVPTRLSKNNGTTSALGTDLSTLRAQKKHIEQAEALDPSIYDYDAAFDALHARDAAKKAVEREDTLQRRPKYMENLLAAAEVRKRDQLRAKDRLLQKEREAEGEEFADRDMFVTEAYKKQQEEVKRVEEEEARREEEEAKKRRGKGMSGFYRSVMDEEEKKHQDAVRAASELETKGIPTALEPTEEKTAADLARELNAKGANVILNDEGQVSDKRQLLTAGLNIAPKRKVDALSSAKNNGSNAHQQRVQSDYRGVGGRNDAQRAMRERQTRMMEVQLEAAAKKAAEEEAEEREKLERAAKSRKTAGEISGAKERYLQRKREAAAAAAAGQG